MFGLTLENSLDEFKTALADLGYDVTESAPYGACGAIKAEKVGITVSVYDYGETHGKTLTIRAEVTNRGGIQY